MRKKNSMLIYIVISVLAFISSGCSNMLDVPGKWKAGVSVEAIGGGYSIAEFDGTLELTTVLGRKPSGDVTFSVSSSDTTEATVSVSSMTFTPENWSTPQSIIVTGVDEYLTDGNQNISIVFGAAESIDPGYSGYIRPSIPITVIDNETDSIVVSPQSGLITTESGGTATFTVVLSSQPDVDVVIPVITSSDATEGVVDKTSLTFTPVNFRVPQMVTVTGLDDKISDGNIDYTIVMDASQSADEHYNAMPVSSVSVTNSDDKGTLGVVVTAPGGGYSLSEFNGSIEAAVSLERKPDANVTIPVSCSDTTEAVLSTAGLTFTASNWNTPQIITITGVDDFVADGNQTANLVFGACVSTDPAFSGYVKNSQAVTVIDNETPGIVVSPKSGAVEVTVGNPGTTEDQNPANKVTFTIVLSSEPVANVTIPDIISSNTLEGTVNKSTLTFTAANWNVPQTVSITGVDDVKWDGNIDYQINIGSSVSTDPLYNAISLASVPVTNIDNEVPNIPVTPTSRTIIEGNTGTFTVKLANMPMGDVTIPVSITNPTRASVNKSSLTFTPANYNTLQTVTVTAIQNSKHDLNTTATVVLGTATNYNNEDPQDVAITITDDDAFEIRFGSLSRHTNEALQNATFGVYLGSEPAADVTVALDEKYTTAKNGSNQEGTISTNSLTFTPLNWSTPQTVTVTGANDDYADGNQVYQIQAVASSTDTDYAGITNYFAVTNDDNDDYGLVIVTNGATSYVKASAATYYNYATDDMNNLGYNYANWTVRLRSQPTLDVTIKFTPSTTDGVLKIDGSITDTAVFTAANWSIPVAVTVEGSTDGTNEGARTYTVTSAITPSLEANYGTKTRVNWPSFSIFSCDNDGSNFIAYCRKSGGFSTSESGGTAPFWLLTQTDPLLVDETVTVTATDEYSYLTGYTIASVTSPAVITTGNFKLLDTAGSNRIVATGRNDDDNPFGGTYYNLYFSSSTPALEFVVPPLRLLNTDNDYVVLVGNAVGSTSESGATATFGVKLRTAPAFGKTVTFTVSSATPTEGTFTATPLTYDSTTWDTWQTITVTGVDDHRVDGPQTISMSYSIVASDDERLDGYPAGSYSTGISNIDNDKLIWLTGSGYYGNMGSGVIQADLASNTTTDGNFPSTPAGAAYKALIADGSTRIARTTATGNTGQHNWVLLPNTEYYIKIGTTTPYTTRIFTTDSNCIPGAFANTTGFSPIAEEYWTGFNSDWTTSADVCGLWSLDNLQGRYGVGNTVVVSDAISKGSAIGNGALAVTRKIIAVQQ